MYKQSNKKTIIEYESSLPIPPKQQIALAPALPSAFLLPTQIDQGQELQYILHYSTKNYNHNNINRDDD